MEDEKKIESAADSGVQSEETAEIREQEQNASHSHHSDHSHYSSHSHHSDHSHHSSHSHHGSHHSSHHHRKSSTKKNSQVDRMQSWVDKRISSKHLIVISLLVVVVLIGSIYVYETYFSNADLADPSGGGIVSDQNENETSGQSSASSAANTSIPSYWATMIREKTKVVKTLQTAGGVDCVSFVWASDTHIPDNSTARTEDLGKLMAKMLDECKIPFAVLTGDVGTRASFDTEAELERAQSEIPLHLAPLWGTERLLVALGNHDGCYGDSSCYYAKQYSPERLWQFYFRGQTLDSRREFSDDGTYFYVDNKAQKTRFIILNSQYGGEYLTDGIGRAVNNRFAISSYGQDQLDWLATVALDMPEGYGAVIATHVPPNETYTVDKVQLIGIINAYCNRTTYTGSYADGVDGWTNNVISVDFTDAKGEIIAMFAGHVHQDTVDTTTLACPLITIISAGAPVNAGVEPDRTFFTDTETSFDVVTINRKTRTIYCTRIGAGEDRVIKY